MCSFPVRSSCGTLNQKDSGKYISSWMKVATGILMKPPGRLFGIGDSVLLVVGMGSSLIVMKEWDSTTTWMIVAAVCFRASMGASPSVRSLSGPK